MKRAKQRYEVRRFYGRRWRARGNWMQRLRPVRVVYGDAAAITPAVIEQIKRRAAQMRADLAAQDSIVVRYGGVEVGLVRPRMTRYYR